jgi:glycine cleavage system T protein (aminomethyltransferase)
MTAAIETPLRKTPLYEEHRRLGARIVPFAGWQMPVQYEGIAAEHRAVRTAAGLFDVSHMGEVEMRGPRAAEVLDRVVTGDISGMPDGKALYTCACNDRGTILDDLIVYRRAPDRFFVICNAGNRDKIAGHLRSAGDGLCEVQDLSDRTALVALQGPKAAEILSRLGPDAAACTGLKSFAFRDARVAGVAATVARTGYTGEDGFELSCANDDAPHLWRALLDAGRDAGLLPVGLGARDTLRLESRLSLYGNDIDETTNPLEAGLGWIVKLDKADFIGKQALVEVSRRGLSRRLVGFEMTGRGIARHGYPLLDRAGNAAGVCTSGGPSPTLGKAIGLGYLPIAMSEVGTGFLVDCRGKPVDAVVVKTPFYRRASNKEAKR